MEETAKNRTRENAEYLYATNQTRKKEADSHFETVRVTQAQERDRKEALEKSWAGREADIQAQEAEIASLKKSVEAYPAQEAAAVQRAVAIATSALKSNLEHSFQLTQKDLETKLALADQATRSLIAEGIKKDNTISVLEARVAEGLNKIESIANAALTSASSTRTLAEMQTYLGNKSENGTTARKS